MFCRSKNAGRGGARRRLGATVLAVALATGSVAIGATAAQAAQPSGCSVTAGVPYKSSGNIKGTGTGSCSSSLTRTFVYQIHREEGFWHPNVAQAQHHGAYRSYSATASNCDAGSGTGTWRYFGQGMYSGYSAVVSGSTGNLTICG